MFKEYAKIYSLINDDKDYENEAEILNNLIVKWTKEKTIFEIGAGEGKHLSIFRDKYNFDVEGIELSDEMCLNAKKKYDINLKNINVINFETTKKYNVILSIFHVISYITETEDLVKVFKKISDLLNDDGVFIFDVWYSPAVNNLKPSTRTKKRENSEIKIERKTTIKEDVNLSLVNVNFDFQIFNKKTKTISKFNELHPMRHFSFNEIEIICKLIGLKIVDFMEFPKIKTPDRESWGALFILKK